MQDQTARGAEGIEEGDWWWFRKRCWEIDRAVNLSWFRLTTDSISICDDSSDLDRFEGQQTILWIWSDTEHSRLTAPVMLEGGKKKGGVSWSLAEWIKKGKRVQWATSSPFLDLLQVDTKTAQSPERTRDGLRNRSVFYKAERERGMTADGQAVLWRIQKK